MSKELLLAHFINEDMKTPFITFAQGHMAIHLRLNQNQSGF